MNICIGQPLLAQVDIPRTDHQGEEIQLRPGMWTEMLMVLQLQLHNPMRLSWSSQVLQHRLQQRLFHLPATMGATSKEKDPTLLLV